MNNQNEGEAKVANGQPLFTIHEKKEVKRLEADIKKFNEQNLNKLQRYNQLYDKLKKKRDELMLLLKQRQYLVQFG